MTVTDMLPQPPDPQESAPTPPKFANPAAALQAAIQACTMQGWQLQSVGPGMATMTYGRPVNHILHLLVGLFTCGVWWLVWLFLVIADPGNRQLLVMVDDDCNITYQGAVRP